MGRLYQQAGECGLAEYGGLRSKSSMLRLTRPDPIAGKPAPTVIAQASEPALNLWEPACRRLGAQGAPFSMWFAIRTERIRLLPALENRLQLATAHQLGHALVEQVAQGLGLVIAGKGQVQR